MSWMPIRMLSILQFVSENRFTYAIARSTAVKCSVYVSRPAKAEVAMALRPFLPGASLSAFIRGALWFITRPYNNCPCRGRLDRGSNKLGRGRNDLGRGKNNYRILISELFYLLTAQKRQKSKVGRTDRPTNTVTYRSRCPWQKPMQICSFQ